MIKYLFGALVYLTCKTVEFAIQNPTIAKIIGFILIVWFIVSSI